MKSKSLFTKVLAFVLCAMMVIGCLPVSAFADDSWEGDLDIMEGVDAANPIQFDFGYRVDTYGFYYTQSQNGMTYYSTYGRNGQWTFEVTGEGNFSVIIGDETIAAVDGVVSKSMAFSPFANQLAFAIDGTGEFAISVAAYIPVGSMNNPAEAVLGDNVADIEAGNNQGYFFTYFAEEDGDLNFKINSITQGVEGDISVTNFSTWANRTLMADGVDGVVTMPVTAGDELQIVVGVMPDASWNYPAANVTFNMAYEPEGPIVDASLKFAQVSLQFAEYIGVQPIMLTSVVKNYDSYYVEAVQYPVGSDPIVTILEPTADSVAAYNVYVLPMLPRAMTDKLTLTIYAEKDGVMYQSAVLETSIADLTMDKIVEYQGKDDLGACKVLVDLLNYGAEVKKAFNYDVENLPNADLGTLAALGTQGNPVISATASNTGSGKVRVYQNTLSMGSRVEVQFVFMANTVAGYELHYTLNGETVEIPASEFDTETVAGAAVAIFALKPRNFRDQLTIGLYDPATGEPVSAVYTTSVEAYAKSNMDQGKYIDLVNAMMNYGDSVLARFPA